MKFDNLQKLWSHCLYCKLCKDTTKELSISTGSVWKFLFYRKKGEILTIKCTTEQNDKKYFATYEINTVDNTFVFLSETPDILEQTFNTKPTVHYNNLILSIDGTCQKCFNTGVQSDGIVLDIADKSVKYFSVRSETVYFRSGRRYFCLSLDYGDEYLELVDNKSMKQVLQLPLGTFDFSDPKRLVSRVKTLLTFS